MGGGSLQREIALRSLSCYCVHPLPPPCRSVTRALGQLLGDCHAVAAMLHCYSRKIAVAQAALLKQLAAGELGGAKEVPAAFLSLAAKKTLCSSPCTSAPILHTAIQVAPTLITSSMLAPSCSARY